MSKVLRVLLKGGQAAILTYLVLLAVSTLAAIASDAAGASSYQIGTGLLELFAFEKRTDGFSGHLGPLAGFLSLAAGVLSAVLTARTGRDQTSSGESRAAGGA